MISTNKNKTFRPSITGGSDIKEYGMSIIDEIWKECETGRKYLAIRLGKWIEFDTEKERDEWEKNNPFKKTTDTNEED